MGSHIDVGLLQKIQRKLENVDRLLFQSGPDSEGKPAAWIWVVLSEHAPEGAWSWESRQRLRSRVIDELEKAGVSDWVYVRFRRADEGEPSDFVTST